MEWRKISDRKYRLYLDSKRLGNFLIDYRDNHKVWITGHKEINTESFIWIKKMTLNKALEIAQKKLLKKYYKSLARV